MNAKRYGPRPTPNLCIYIFDSPWFTLDTTVLLLFLQGQPKYKNEHFEAKSSPQGSTVYFTATRLGTKYFAVRNFVKL